MSAHMPTHMSTYMSTHMPTHISTHMQMLAHMSIHMSAHMSTRMPTRIFIYVTQDAFPGHYQWLVLLSGSGNNGGPPEPTACVQPVRKFEINTIVCLLSACVTHS